MSNVSLNNISYICKWTRLEFLLYIKGKLAWIKERSGYIIHGVIPMKMMNPYPSVNLGNVYNWDLMKNTEVIHNNLGNSNEKECFKSVVHLGGQCFEPKWAKVTQKGDFKHNFHFTHYSP